MSSIPSLPPIQLATPTLSTADKLNLNTPERIKAAGVELEGVFASMLLQTMRKSVGEEGLFAGDSSDVLGGMFDLHMGRTLAQSGGLGVAQMVEQYAKAQELS